MYCLWPPHYYKLGVHMYCLWPPHYYKLGTRRGEESPWTISVYYFSICTVCGHYMYTISVDYFSMCVYPCSITICCISAYTIIM